MTIQDFIKKHDSEPEFVSMTTNQKLWSLLMAVEYANIVTVETVTNHASPDLMAAFKNTYELGYFDRGMVESGESPKFTEREIEIRIQMRTGYELRNL